MAAVSLVVWSVLRSKGLSGTCRPHMMQASGLEIVTSLDPNMAFKRCLIHTSFHDIAVRESPPELGLIRLQLTRKT